MQSQYVVCTLIRSLTNTSLILHSQSILLLSHVRLDEWTQRNVRTQFVSHLAEFHPLVASVALFTSTQSRSQGSLRSIHTKLYVNAALPFDTCTSVLVREIESMKDIFFGAAWDFMLNMFNRINSCT